MADRAWKLDGDELYRIKTKLGLGFAELTRKLAEEGAVNPYTGKPFTKSGIVHAVKSSALWQEEIASRKERQEKTEETIRKISAMVDE